MANFRQRQDMTARDSHQPSLFLFYAVGVCYSAAPTLPRERRFTV